MEVICSRKVLHRGLQAVGRAVSGRSTLPILSNVNLKAEGTDLRLLGTDLEIWMESALPVEVKAEGAITVPARLLSEVVGALPEATVQLKADDKGTMTLVCGNANYEIRGLPSEEFPALPEVGKETCFDVKQELLAGLINKTIFAASTDETRAILTGALLLWEGKRVRMVATDSYRLSIKGAELEEAAKQLISATSLLQAIYFAAISFSELKEGLVVEGTKDWLLVLLFVLPIVLWLASLCFAVRVFKPETYRTNLSSPDLARSMYGEMVAYKHRQLRRAHQFLVLGFVPLAVNIVLYLAWI